jgi:hypothetical protein
MAFGRNKEIEKRMLIKQTINSMNKQIQKLEEQKEVYLRAGKEAKTASNWYCSSDSESIIATLR